MTVLSNPGSQGCQEAHLSGAKGRKRLEQLSEVVCRLWGGRGLRLVVRTRVRVASVSGRPLVDRASGLEIWLLGKQHA